MNKPKILVTSAGGNTGLPTTLQLLEKGYPVRAFLRRHDQRAQRLKAAGAEIFIGDQYALADMRRATRGVQRAYHCTPAAPNGLHFGTIFAIAANEAKLEHVVTLSQWLADPDHLSVATRETWFNDELIKLLPETTLTINNVGWFAENYFFVLESIAQLGIMPMPLGNGDLKGNAPPSNEDIAAVNVAALIDPATHAGKTYRPTGPTLLTTHEIAAILGDLLGHNVRYVNLPEALFLKMMKAGDAPEFMLTQLRHYMDEYRRGTFAVHAPTTVLPDVVGREAEDFATIAQRYVATRPEAVRTIRTQWNAITNFMKGLLTTKPNIAAIEQRREHVLLAQPAFAQEATAWRQNHDPKAGYQPDRPITQHQAVDSVSEKLVYEFAN